MMNSKRKAYYLLVSFFYIFCHSISGQDQKVADSLAKIYKADTARGVAKIVERCTFPITSTRRVDLIVTELAVIEPTERGLVLRETAPGVSVEQVRRATQAHLTVPEGVLSISP